uniref:Uncharacterized protein n=1 Tax=Salarias fasciatus TaxID=181472 RepID=A0A672GQ43_SALFA
IPLKICLKSTHLPRQLRSFTLKEQTGNCELNPGSLIIINLCPGFHCGCNSTTDRLSICSPSGGHKWKLQPENNVNNTTYIITLPEVLLVHHLINF